MSYPAYVGICATAALGCLAVSLILFTWTQCERAARALLVLGVVVLGAAILALPMVVEEEGPRPRQEKLDCDKPDCGCGCKEDEDCRCASEPKNQASDQAGAALCRCRRGEACRCRRRPLLRCRCRHCGCGRTCPGRRR
jgi:hypothetical protein